MSLMYIGSDYEGKGATPVSRENPLPVRIQDSYTRFPVIAKVTAVTNASAYDANDCVGGVMTLQSVLTAVTMMGYLKNLTIVDHDNQKAILEILIFKWKPIYGTYTDDANITLAGDAAHIIGRIAVAAADYATIGVGDTPDKAVAYKNLSDMPVTSDADGNLYVVAMCTATPTYSTTKALDFIFGIDRLV